MQKALLLISAIAWSSVFSAQTQAEVPYVAKNADGLCPAGYSDTTAFSNFPDKPCVATSDALLGTTLPPQDGSK